MTIDSSVHKTNSDVTPATLSLDFVARVSDFIEAESSARSKKQQAQLSPSDRAMRLVSSNLANCHATVQKLLIRQVLTKLMV